MSSCGGVTLTAVVVLSMILKFIWWWDSSFGDLGSRVYTFIVNTLRSTLSRTGSTCWAYIYESTNIRLYCMSPPPKKQQQQQQQSLLRSNYAKNVNRNEQWTRFSNPWHKINPDGLTYTQNQSINEQDTTDYKMWQTDLSVV